MKNLIEELEDFAVHCLHLSWRSDKQYNLNEAWEDYKSSNSSGLNEAKAVRQNEQTQEVYSNDDCVFNYCPHPKLCKSTKHGCTQL